MDEFLKQGFSQLKPPITQCAEEKLLPTRRDTAFFPVSQIAWQNNFKNEMSGIALMSRKPNFQPTLMSALPAEVGR